MENDTTKIITNKSNIRKILEGSEIVLDCTDNFETRKVINAYCLNEKKILIS